jgi:DNA-binding NtrC family response regulator
VAHENKVCIVTYYGVDGACGAAAVLLAFPDATVMTSSAARIGETLSTLSHGEWNEVHICGVGVSCDWSQIEIPALAMRSEGVKVFWHCGREYLRDEEQRISLFCAPAFQSLGTNTASIIRSLDLGDRCDGHLLAELALCDKHVKSANGDKAQSLEQTDWTDFIEASISHYFKYLDQEAYTRAIHKLAKHELTPQDRVMIDIFRRSGYRYMLHGSSPATRELKRRIQRCSEINRHVIITGESGVGKEHVAHLLAEAGSRASGPFVPVNCASYAENSNLANSDLFGHLKGAFTGAITNRPGRFVEADTGILFLDELGELPLEVQAKLLRVIEDGWVTPEGADNPQRQVNVRIVSATNRDLSTMIRKGSFRADLYHRIATLRIHVPALRERVEDIPRIVEERLAVLEKEGYRTRLTRKSYKALEQYPWPGNVRQLLKILDRAVLLGMSVEDAILEEQTSGEAAQYADDLQGPSDLLFPTTMDQVRTMKELQKLYANNVWELCGQNYATTARLLGVNPNTLRYTYLKSESQ